MRGEKVEKIWGKICSTCCKWSNLNAPGSGYLGVDLLLVNCSRSFSNGIWRRVAQPNVTFFVGVENKMRRVDQSIKPESQEIFRYPKQNKQSDRVFVVEVVFWVSFGSLYRCYIHRILIMLPVALCLVFNQKVVCIPRFWRGREPRAERAIRMGESQRWNES